MKILFIFFVAFLIAIVKSTEIEEAGRIIEDYESEKFQNDEIIDMENTAFEENYDEEDPAAEEVNELVKFLLPHISKYYLCTLKTSYLYYYTVNFISLKVISDLQSEAEVLLENTEEIIAEEIGTNFEAEDQSNHSVSTAKKVHLHISAVINSFTNLFSNFVAAIFKVLSRFFKLGRK